MRVHPTVDLLAAYAWRLIVLAVVALGAIWVIGRLWVVLMSLVIATFLTRVLTPIAERLRGRLPNALAAAATLLGFIALLVAVLGLVGIAVVNEVDNIGPTVNRAIDSVEDWLVEDSPFNVTREDIEDFRSNLGDRLSNAVRDSSGTIINGAVIAAEVALSLILGLIITFFMLKDGSRFVTWVQGSVAEERRDVISRMAERSWRTLGGYLRGSAILGLLEGVIIGTTLWLVGAELAVPMATITFIAAFVPFVGAIVAGALAVAVALATAGTIEALIVLVVAFLVQQFDNDILAPWIFGKALEIHPVVILIAITTGGILFGIGGSFLAVPVTAVVMNAIAEARNGPEPDAEPEAAPA
ncbi:MAG TPA: AI-2E family transporter [Acidimicrobiales bacterium]|nr:AI-2E family transporter [Acidimicrobiales bacterium]